MTSQRPFSANQLAFPWQDSERPIEEHVGILLAEISLKERVGQLGSRWVGNDSPESGAALTPPEAPETESNQTLNGAPHADVFA